MAIQMNEANELRKRWEEMGNKPCNHPSKTKEYYLGTATGDYICTKCGETFWEGRDDEQEGQTLDENN